MNIDASNLVRNLASRMVELDPSGEKTESYWKEVLKFPAEGWSPASEEDQFSIMDPAMVLGRMFCVRMDIELDSMLIDKGIEYPLSWLLRVMEEEKWSVAEVLEYSEKESAWINDQKKQINEYYPELFNDTNGAHGMEKFLKKASDRLSRCTFVHLSAPRFHHEWNRLIGKKEVRLDGSTGWYLDWDDIQVAEKAKQQWSTKVSYEIEKFANDYCSTEEGELKSWVLQAGGGHVLLAVNSQYEKERELFEKWVGQLTEYLQRGWTIKRGWAPQLWASWQADEVKKPVKRKGNLEGDKGRKKILNDLEQEFIDDKGARGEIRKRWAPFGHLKSSPSQKTPVTLYLDVIGLGDYCWPKKKISRSGLYPTREETIDGFRKSRRMTALIESTFGSIMAMHPPKKILSMGGDELIGTIDKSQWMDIVTLVEKHAFKLNELMGDQYPKHLWWLMYWEEAENLPDLKGFKDTLREGVQDWGMRYVNPMWNSMAKEVIDKDAESGEPILLEEEEAPDDDDFGQGPPPNDDFGQGPPPGPQFSDINLEHDWTHGNERMYNLTFPGSSHLPIICIMNIGDQEYYVVAEVSDETEFAYLEMDDWSPPCWHCDEQLDMYPSRPEMPEDVEAHWLLYPNEIPIINIRWLRWICDSCERTTTIDGSASLNEGESELTVYEKADPPTDMIAPANYGFAWVAEGVYWPGTTRLRSWPKEHDARKAWCRQKYGQEWWKVSNSIKRERLKNARVARELDFD